MKLLKYSDFKEDSHFFSDQCIRTASVLRNLYGKTVVQSTFRTKWYNSTVKGAATNSQHIKSVAIDLRVKNHKRMLYDCGNKGFINTLIEAKQNEIT